MSEPKIIKIISVEDTRQYECLDDDKWYPISGSGTDHPCDRCGKNHEIHATVVLDNGKEAVVGTTCMKTEDLDVQRQMASATNAAKRLRVVEAEEARYKQERKAWDDAVATVKKMAKPPLEGPEPVTFDPTETEHKTERLGNLFKWTMGDAWVWDRGRVSPISQERRQTLENAWENRRLMELIGRTTPPHARYDFEREYKKLSKILGPISNPVDSLMAKRQSELSRMPAIREGAIAVTHHPIHHHGNPSMSRMK